MRETEGFRPQLFILHYSSFIIHYWVYRPDKPEFEKRNNFNLYHFFTLSFADFLTPGFYNDGTSTEHGEK